MSPGDHDVLQLWAKCGHTLGPLDDTGQRRVKEADTAVHARPVPARSVHARKNRDRRDEPTRVVDERQSRLGRRPKRRAREIHPPSDALQHIVVARLSRPRPGQP